MVLNLGDVFLAVPPQVFSQMDPHGIFVSKKKKKKLFRISGFSIISENDGEKKELETVTFTQNKSCASTERDLRQKIVRSVKTVTGTPPIELMTFKE